MYIYSVVGSLKCGNIVEKAVFDLHNVLKRGEKVVKLDKTELCIRDIHDALGLNEQYDAHVWGIASYYRYWNAAPWPAFDHVQAWGEWSDANMAIGGDWI